jgi:acetate kinase
MQEEKMTVDEVMTLLNEKSGLLAISDDSLDTRVLMKHYDSDPQVNLAIHMFPYRVRKAVGAYFAALGSGEALIFGEASRKTTRSSVNMCPRAYARSAWRSTTTRIKV